VQSNNNTNPFAKYFLKPCATSTYILCQSSNLPLRKALFTSTMLAFHPASNITTKTTRIVVSFTTGLLFVSLS
jgi:hypothetical protein